MALRTHAKTALLTGVYAIVNEGDPDPVALTQAVLRAGVRIVQYRAKAGIVAHHARQIRALTKAHEALFLLNDAWRVVQAFDADGVHLGPDDARSEELGAIRLALNGRIIGLSCGTPEEARAAQIAGADYIGAGSVYATSSKADAGEPIGIAGLRRIAASCTIPVAAIGGISADRIAEIRASGVAMAAVISAISCAPDPFEAACALVRNWNTA